VGAIDKKELRELRKNCEGYFFPVYLVFPKSKKNVEVCFFRGKNSIRLNRSGVKCFIETLRHALHEIKP
jgi:hypothetical protein